MLPRLFSAPPQKKGYKILGSQLVLTVAKRFFGKTIFFSAIIGRISTRSEK
jgi:hypothetical protein